MRRKLWMAALFAVCCAAATGCTGRMEQNAMAAETARSAEPSGTDGEDAAPAAEQAGAGETYPGTMEARESEETGYYGVMYARVAETQTDETGLLQYRLQDLNDTENVWTLSDLEVGLVETELAKGSLAAFLFSGDMIYDADHVTFIAAVPYTAYLLGNAEGVLENNLVSSFDLRTDSGETLHFLKDNCSTEDGALSGGDGRRLRVYYAHGETDTAWYPLEIALAD